MRQNTKNPGRDVRERPILFSAEMIRALIEGRKTQTRRIVKLPEGFDWELFNDDGEGTPHFHRRTGEFTVVPNVRDAIGVHDVHVPHVIEHIPANPYGVPGDFLYVREAFRGHAGGITSAGYEIGLAYAAGGYKPSRNNLVSREEYNRYIKDAAHETKWRPSIHMPRWASRLTLEITEVRVERLQSISGDDCNAEGLLYIPAEEDEHSGDAPNWLRAEYAKLWDSLNAKRNGGAYAWKKSPWVWVLSCSVVSPSAVLE